MAILVMTVEATVRSNLDDLSDWMSFTWRYASRDAEKQASRAEVLFLGDSLMKGGVWPPFIESNLKVSAYNLSVQGGTAPSSYFFLKRLVDAGARPRVVVVDFHPNLLAVAPRSNQNWADLLTLSELADLTRQAADPVLFVKTALYQMFPSYRHRVPVRGAILASLRGEPVLAHRLNSLLRTNFERHGGPRLLPVTPQTSSVDPTAGLGSRRIPWRAHPSNVVYVRRLMKLAEANGLAMVWLLPPTSPDWMKRRREMNAEAPYEAFVKKIQAEFPSVWVFDGRDSGYPSSAFRDLTHLHAGGAGELSLALASRLQPFFQEKPKPIRSEPRWVRLPPYAGRPVDPSIEVLDDVQVALRPAADSSRH